MYARVVGNGHVAVGLSCACCAENTLSASKSAKPQQPAPIECGHQISSRIDIPQVVTLMLGIPKDGAHMFLPSKRTELDWHCVIRHRKWIQSFEPLLSFSHHFTMKNVPCKRFNANHTIILDRVMEQIQDLTAKDHPVSMHNLFL